MRVIIVDDEPLARDILKTYCSKVPAINLVACFDNAIEAGEFLRTEEVDLMMLDIQMPELNGIDFVKSLQNPPKIVFTTAYPEHAVEGFALNAEDYLVKPIAFDRFYKAFTKVGQQLELEENSENSSDSEDHIYVKADKKLRKLFFKDVYYIEGLKDYVIIKLEKERIVTLQTMKSLGNKLPKDIFQRIHRSFIINLDQIDSIYGNVVEMTIKGETKHLPIGKNYKDDLIELVNQNRL